MIVIRRKINTMRSLPAPSRATFFSSLALIPMTSLLLRVLGYNRLSAFLGLHPDITEDSQEIENQWVIIGQVEVGFNLALKYSPWRGTCLSRSVSLMTLLRRRGVTVNLRIGVSSDEKPFQAHAWLESKGEALKFDKGLNQQFNPLC